MAGGVNKVILIGNVGKDPDVRSSSDGREMASFTLATSESWKDKSGVRQEHTEWHNLVIFASGLCNVVKNYVKKGSKLYIEGSLRTRKWQKDGIDRYTTEVVVANLTMLDNKNSSSNSSMFGSADGSTFSSSDNVAFSDSSWDVQNVDAGSTMEDDSIPF